MGGGSYSYLESHTRSMSSYSTKSREQIFTKRHLDSEMNIKGKVRECCDTEEHPNTLPIIIGLDVTGSMGHIPEDLIKHSFPEIMKNILDAGVTDPEVCFVGLGDFYFDDAPFQAGQFEASDAAMEKWLMKTYLEGHGGGNMGESYNGAWYFALKHVKCDAIIKRHKKGVIITIGDEPCLKEIPESNIINVYGDNTQGRYFSEDMLKALEPNWNVYHIHLGDSDTAKDDWYSYPGWQDLLGDNALYLSKSNYNIIKPIAECVIKTFKENSGDVITVSNNTTSTESEVIL